MDSAAQPVAPNHRGGAVHSLLNLARQFLSESLFKNSAFLIVNLGVGAVCGYGSLTLLTHIFSTAEVGISATAVSALSLITLITQFGITYSLPRYLPIAKNRTAMINTLLTAAMLAAMLGCVIFLTLPYAKKLWVLGGLGFGIAFVVTAGLQAGQTVVGAVLIADRASDKLATAGLVPNLARVAAPPALSFLGALGAFTARVIADLFGFVTFGVLLARRGHRFRPTLDVGVVRDMARFSAGMYLANIIGGLPQLLLPLVVLSRIGPQQSAYWSVAISIAALLFSLPSVITTALLPEVSVRPKERKALLARAAKLIVVLVLPALVAAYLLAPFGLSLFGGQYATGAVSALHWLLIASFITMLNYVTGAVLFIAKKSMMMTIVNLINAVVVLGMVFFWATNVVQIAISWVVGDIANTSFIALFAYIALRQVGWRWEALGGDADAASAVDAAYKPLTATSQFRALNVLTTLAQQQGQSAERYELYRPYHSNSLTDTGGLFSIIALRAAERERAARLAASEAGAGNDTGSGSPAERSAEGADQALDLLFRMAEQQRAPGPFGEDDLGDTLGHC